MSRELTLEQAHCLLLQQQEHIEAELKSAIKKWRFNSNTSTADFVIEHLDLLTQMGEVTANLTLNRIMRDIDRPAMH